MFKLLDNLFCFDLKKKTKFDCHLLFFALKSLFWVFNLFYLIE